METSIRYHRQFTLGGGFFSMRIYFDYLDLLDAVERDVYERPKTS